MRQIDRDVHEAYRDFERAVQLTQSYPLGKHLSSLIQTTGNDLENRYLLSEPPTVDQPAC